MDAGRWANCFGGLDSCYLSLAVVISGLQAKRTQARCHQTPGLFSLVGLTATWGSRVQLQPRGPKRKGKPMGDGIRLLPGRALSLEGSTPSPSAPCGPAWPGKYNVCGDTNWPVRLLARSPVFQAGQRG